HELEAGERERRAREPRLQVQRVAEEEAEPAAGIRARRDRLLVGEQADAERDERAREERHDEPPRRAGSPRRRLRACEAAQPGFASSSARRTSTRARWRRYSALPFVSLGGSVPSSATAAGSDSPASSACSVARARSGVAPMLTSPTAASWMLPFPLITATTPTVAQSIERRRNFR